MLYSSLGFSSIYKLTLWDPRLRHLSLSLSLSLLSHVVWRFWDREYELWQSWSFAWSDWDTDGSPYPCSWPSIPVLYCDIFTYSKSFLIHSLLRLLVVWNLFMCSLDYRSMYYNCSILHLVLCVGEVCWDLFLWWVHWLFTIFFTSLLLWTWSWFICFGPKERQRFMSQCFGYDLCLLRHGVRFSCRHDFQLDGSTFVLRWVVVVVHIFLVVEHVW
jgi:hypothetical protein